MTALRSRPPAPLRWAAVVPAALLATVVAQVAFMWLAGRVLFSFSDVEPDQVMWAAKAVASPFMGATFVAGAAWVAPTRRRAVASVAAAAVVAWGLAIAVGAGTWGPSIGGLGIAGALGALAAVRRADR